MVTEYERLLLDMLEERRSKLNEIKGRKAKDKEVQALESDVKFLEVEIQRYQQGLSLFRSKGIPKVGRWGKPEAEAHEEE